MVFNIGSSSTLLRLSVIILYLFRLIESKAFNFNMIVTLCLLGK